LRHLFADSVYNGPKLHEALAKFGDWTTSSVSVMSSPNLRSRGLPQHRHRVGSGSTPPA
jgi:hypothetical protein